MEDKWTILSPDLSNEPEDWEKFEIEIFVDSCWHSYDFYELEKSFVSYHFRFRPKPKENIGYNMENDWKVLDLKNPPDLTVEYDWEYYNASFLNWAEFTKDTAHVLFTVFEYITEGVQPLRFRYRLKPKKRTLEEVADKYSRYEDYYIIRMEAYQDGFRAARSGEYDDVEVE